MTAEPQETVTPQEQRSTFVNVLAWIFIIFGGFATFIGILQNIMLYAFHPIQEVSSAAAHSESSENLPAFAQLMFDHFDLFFFLALVFSATSFISAIALLNRKNWARIIFIFLMGVGIAWNIFGLIMQFTLLQSTPEIHPPQPELESMVHVMQIASVVMVAAMISLFGFVIKKLCSQQIRREFV